MKYTFESPSCCVDPRHARISVWWWKGQSSQTLGCLLWCKRECLMRRVAQAHGEVAWMLGAMLVWCFALACCVQLFSDKKVDQKRENKFLNFLMAAFCAARLITYKDAFTGNFPESNNLYGLDPTCGRICRSAQFVEACVAAPLWVLGFSGAFSWQSIFLHFLYGIV